jgi:PhnB protein
LQEAKASKGETMTSNHSKAQPVSKDYGSLTSYVVVRGVAKFIDFLKEAFGGVERIRIPNEDGTLGHAEVWLGNRVLMMFDAKKDWPDTPSFLTLYVEDCDAAHQRALKAGAVEITKLGDFPFGFRASRIRDPFGNIWWLQSQVEKMNETEMMETMMERIKDKDFLGRMMELVQTFDQELKNRNKH